jgi:Cu(I)/Ag(I) efflux system membrane fusion protein
MKTLLIAFLALTFSINVNAQDSTNHQHKDHLKTLVSEYLQLKDALVASEFDEAKSHLSNFSEEVNNNAEMMDHSEKHGEMHEEHHGAMASAIESAQKAENIKELRASFEGISDQLVKAIENQGFEDEQLFVQFCPMADGGDGAHWISNAKEIKNPYYGSMMLTCGKVVKEL